MSNDSFLAWMVERINSERMAFKLKHDGSTIIFKIYYGNAFMK